MIQQNNDKNILLTRLLLSLSILVFIRIGTFLPVPGINHGHLAFYLERHSMTKSLVSTFAGNNTFVIGLFTLNIFPYINASILMQLLISLFPSLSKLQKEGGGEGRRTINKLTRLITLGWALIQSFSIAFYLKRALFDWDIYLAAQIMIWLTTGAMIVLWLSEIITEYGLGNGASLLIYTNIVSNLPNIGKNLVTQTTENVALSSWGFIVALFFVAIYGIVLLQEGTRVVPLISSKQLTKMTESVSSSGLVENNYIPLRFNQAGVMPIILTTSFLVIPNYLINLGIFQSLNFLINFKWIYWIGYFVLILAFSSFYSSIVLNPKDISDQLQKSAVKIPGVRPGVQTIFYLKQEIQRITLMGATLLAFITIIPNFIESTLNITSLNGLSTTSFLILGGVVLDLKREVSNIYFSEIYTDMYR